MWLQVNELKRANNLSDLRVQPGQVLKIPIHSDQTCRVFIKPTKPAAPRGTFPHIVQKGETLSKIAAHYNIPVSTLALQMVVLMKGYQESLLADVNNLKANVVLRISQVIYVMDGRNRVLSNHMERPMPAPPLEALNEGAIQTQSARHLFRQRSLSSGNLKDPKLEPQRLRSSPSMKQPTPEVDSQTSKARVLDCKGVLLIPHSTNHVFVDYVALADRITLTASNGSEEWIGSFPSEIPLRHVMHAKIVKRLDVVHSSYVEEMEGIGPLTYLQVIMGPLAELSHFNYYLGMGSDKCEALCYFVLQFICEASLKASLENKVKAEEVGRPRLSEASAIFTEDMFDGLKAIRNNLPPKFRFYNWHLVFSTERDGYSLRTFYHKLELWTASILFVEDSEGHVFGAYASGEWSQSESYQGSGESFLFQLHPKVRLFPWIQSNSCFMLAKHDHIEMGAG